MAPQRVTGDFVTSVADGISVKAFVPKPLPPDPPLRITPVELDLVERANRALGRLDGITDVIPDKGLFISFYVMKEALLSSQIEGTQSSMQELLLFEVDEEEPSTQRLDDVREVSNYVRALDHSAKILRQESLPVSNRFMRDAHEILLSSGRGSSKAPGEFRRTQNWLGGATPKSATFVPPPPDYVEDGMAELERFLHDDPERTPTLIKVALAHAQFETLHPFLDGNGRLGRLMITLTLCAENVLTYPLLYLSLYFKVNRDEYYRRLQAVRTDGDWEGWLRFFLEGVIETAGQAVAAAQRLLALFERDRKRIEENLGRAASSALRVHEYLQRHPFVRTPKATEELGLSAPTIDRALQRMERLGVVQEITGLQRRRQYAYTESLAIIGEGTEPLGQEKAEATERTESSLER